MSPLSKETIGEIQIVAACGFFSLAFVGQRYAMTQSDIGPFTFNAVRYMASLATLQIFKPLLVQYSTIDGIDDEPDGEYVTRNGGSRSLLFWVMLAGLSNFGGSMLQQYSLMTLETAKVAFITGSYVVIIPFVEWLWPMVFGYPAHCVSPKIWTGVILSFIGLYYLSGCGDAGANCLDMNSAQTIGLICVTISVLFWTVNIMMADQASKQVDCLTLTMGEFSVVIVLTTIVAIALEPQNWVYPFTNIFDCWKTIIIVGICEALAYIISTIGQMYVRPSRASIIYSVGEALGASTCGYLILGETLTLTEVFGGALMLVAAGVSSTTIADDVDEEDNNDKDYLTVDNTEAHAVDTKPSRPSMELRVLNEMNGNIEVVIRGNRNDMQQPSGYSEHPTSLASLTDDEKRQLLHSHHHHSHHHNHAVHLNTQPYSYGST